MNCRHVVWLMSLPLLAAAQHPIHVTYLWHMHQPVYFPYESVNATDANGRYNFSVAGVHGERAGNYTTWPKEAVEQGHNRAGLEHSGAQVSFSGSLGENLNGLWGDAGSANWDDAYDYARNTLRTSFNNPRLDMVGIAYHHSLMPLTCKESMKMQVRLHKEITSELWDTGGGYSKGFWPPECAFSSTIIPALVEEGLEWVLVDNGHFDRACQGYPWVDATSIRPNRADQLNADPTNSGSAWIQLNNIWAPSKVSAPWGYQPHYVKHVNPWTGAEQKMVAVPCGRYEGNENGRGGYGSFKPENVWGSHVGANNNAARPMIIVCHSDGDNYGMKNSDAFHGQHGNFLNMCQANASFDNTTVQDYLQLYPVPTNDVIHIEPGSWVGIDGGTPYFDKWRENNAGFRGDPNEHPDFWSWSVIVAAQNRVLHADRLESGYSMNDVQWGIGSDTARAWHFYLQGETSCHWYWDYDRANPWDGNATRACNLAIAEANKVIGRHGNDPQPPSIFPPQRTVYNPGAKHWNEAGVQPADFAVWSYVDDVSGLAAVRLYWRADLDGQNPIAENDNEVYAHNAAKVGAWTLVGMTNSWYPAGHGPQVPDPANRAQLYTGWILGQNNVLLDYFVEAVDGAGNTNRSDIMHVFVGTNVASPVVTIAPALPEVCKDLTITYNPAGRPLQGISPVKVQLDWEPAVAAPSAPDMLQTNGVWVYTTAIPAGQTNVVFHFHNGAGTLDDNGGLNWSTPISVCSTGPAAALSFDPPSPNGCGDVTISYSPNYGALKGATSVVIHIGRNGWQDVPLPDPVMQPSGTGTWTYVFTNQPGTLRINCVFHNGVGQWDNNQGADYGVDVVNCTGGITGIMAVAGSPFVPDDPAGQNTPGEVFAFSTAGQSPTAVNQGGFGAFGQLYINYDATYFYIGGRGVDLVGDNNALVVLLGFDTLGDNANHLWDKAGGPRALDQLHNLWLPVPGMDVAIVLGDEWGDGTYPSFNLGNGYDMGQGAFYLSATSFVPVAGARLAQFDGTGTNAVVDVDDDTNSVMDRWSCAIPWSSLNATGVASLGQCHLAALFVSDGTNGNDRYLSGNVIGVPQPATNGNYGFGFLTLEPLLVQLPNQDTDGDGLPDWWEQTHWGSPVAGAREVDLDQDGFSNFDEYRLGTQPTNLWSLLDIAEIASTGAQRRISWRSVGGRGYVLEFSDDLGAGFQPLLEVAETNVAEGVESVASAGDTNAPPVRTYRIRLAP
jgi:hypothetical protein